jgi:hypothetical protein
MRQGKDFKNQKGAGTMKKTFYGILTETKRDTFIKISKATNREDAIHEADLDWWKYTTPSERKEQIITVREVEVDITADMDEKGIEEAVMDALAESEDYFHIFDQESVEGPVYRIAAEIAAQSKS